MRTFTRASIAIALLLSLSSAAFAAGELFVTSSRNSRVIRYDAESGASLGTFVSSGSGGLNFPEAMIFGPGGDLLVSSFGTDQILRYDGQTGALVGTFVPAGSGGLDGPSGLVIVGGKLLVTSSRSDRVLSYDIATGAFLGAFITPVGEDLADPLPIAKGPDGNLYVGSAGSSRVDRYDGQTGAFLGTFVAFGVGGLSGPFGLAFGPGGHLYVASYATDSILRYDGKTGVPLGAFVASGVGGLDGPIGIAFGPTGDLYVASTINGRVLRYNGSSGAFLGIVASDGAAGLDGPTALLFRPPLLTGPCARNAQTACLLDDRFEVKVKMRNFTVPPVTFPGEIQTYQGVSSETDQSVSFYSFADGNVEVFVKMVDACAAPAFHSHWLFAAGATNAYTQIVVRDTVAGDVYEIVNQSGVLFPTVADTRAFLTCDP